MEEAREETHGFEKNKIEKQEERRGGFRDDCTHTRNLTQDLKQDGALLALAERTTHLGFAEPSKSYPYRRQRS